MGRLKVVMPVTRMLLSNIYTVLKKSVRVRNKQDHRRQQIYGLKDVRAWISKIQQSIILLNGFTFTKFIIKRLYAVKHGRTKRENNIIDITCMMHTNDSLMIGWSSAKLYAYRQFPEIIRKIVQAYRPIHIVTLLADRYACVRLYKDSLLVTIFRTTV